MNWEPRFDPGNLGKVERHNLTDEVFVLMRGQGLLFIDTDGTIQAIDMQPGFIYNVTAGTWHGVLGTHEASWLIVESSDTKAENSDCREMNNIELDTLRRQYPAWLKV
jgi:mannose-6-phosphate isomerase-like protein (cupin superfamily)